jgi:hypothetical protein
MPLVLKNGRLTPEDIKFEAVMYWTGIGVNAVGPILEMIFSGWLGTKED